MDVALWLFNAGLIALVWAAAALCAALTAYVVLGESPLQFMRRYWR